MSLMDSNGVIDRIISRFELDATYRTQYRQHTRNALRGATRMTSGKDGLIAVEVDDPSPMRAADIANAYAEELGIVMSRLALTEAQQRRIFFEKQLDQTKENLIKAEIALKAIGVTPDVMRKSPEATIAEVAGLRAAIFSKELKLQSMRGFLTENAPEYAQAVRELRTLQGQLDAQERNTRPTTSVDDYTTRFREFKYQETLFELFAKQYELAKVDESRDGALLQVVDKAAAPELKSKPKKALIALMTTLGVAFVMLVVVFVREAFRAAAQRPDHAVRLARISRALLRRHG